MSIQAILRICKQNQGPPVKLPHYLQFHIEQMLHCAVESHFLSQEVLVEAPNHHHMQYQPGCVSPRGEKVMS